LDDVIAALNNLRTDERMWHGSQSKEKSAEILRKQFLISRNPELDALLQPDSPEKLAT
jgi:hypothetical protein